MSVILQIANFAASRSWSGYPTLAITNSGDENAKNLYLKVTDSSVFTVLKHHHQYGYSNCLNVFGSAYVWPLNFAAGTSVDVIFNTTIKGDAPIQVHHLTCDFQYEVY